MLSKDRISHITSLHHKKFRDEHKQFLAEGEKLVNELMASKFHVHSLYATNEWRQSAAAHLNKISVPVTEVSEKEMKKISTLATPPGVLAVVERPAEKLTGAPWEDQLVLALDNIQDPGNMGTIIRIADWFGIRHIICSENTVGCYNPKVVQSSMGSIFRVEINTCDLKNILEGIKKNTPVYAALVNGKNVYTEKLKNKGVLLLGNESKGISEALLPYTTHHIRIPSWPEESTSAESLNVAAAAAILCSEFRRIR